MAEPAEFGYGEGAEGDPGPIVTEFSPLESSDRTEARGVVVDDPTAVRIVATFPAQADEIVWSGDAFVAPYARHSSVFETPSGDWRFLIARTVGWPSNVALRIEALGEGETVCLGGGKPLIIIVS